MIKLGPLQFKQIISLKISSALKVTCAFQYKACQSNIYSSFVVHLSNQTSQSKNEETSLRIGQIYYNWRTDINSILIIVNNKTM